MLSKGEHEHEDQQQWIVESTESLFSGRTTRVDVLKVETDVGKDTYALTDIRWGAYREAHKSYSSWWFLPGAGMKGYAAHLRRCFKPNLVSELDVSYNSPLEVHKPVVARPSGPFKTESTFFLQKDGCFSSAVVSHWRKNGTTSSSSRGSSGSGGAS